MASGEISIRAAAKKYSSPRATIKNKQKGSHGSSVGRRGVFTDVEENLFAFRIISMCNRGFPVDNDLKATINAYLHKQDRVIPRFIQNIPGDDWMRSFVKRHQLTQNYASDTYKKTC